eukprot:6233-Heterococcus_DN1.PRE.1
MQGAVMCGDSVQNSLELYNPCCSLLCVAVTITASLSQRCTRAHCTLMLAVLCCAPVCTQTNCTRLRSYSRTDAAALAVVALHALLLLLM